MRNPALRIPAIPSWIASSGFVAVLVLGPALAPALASGEAASTRLCLASNELPFEQGDPRIEILEAKIAARFEEGYFSVVGGEPVLAVIEAIDADAGPAFDSTTAEAIRGPLDADPAALGRALREKLGCEARIRIRVESVLARIDGQWAVWDGARISIYADEHDPVERSPEMRGWVAALSLWVELVDVEGRELAFRSAAIEPLVHLATFRPIDRLPDDRWLQDEKALDAAIERALGPKALYLRDRGNPAWRFPESSLVWPKS